MIYGLLASIETMRKDAAPSGTGSKPDTKTLVERLNKAASNTTLKIDQAVMREAGK